MCFLRWPIDDMSHVPRFFSKKGEPLFFPVITSGNVFPTVTSGGKLCPTDISGRNVFSTVITSGNLFPAVISGENALTHTLEQIARAQAATKPDVFQEEEN